jgi:hypothetical protein
MPAVRRGLAVRAGPADFALVPEVIVSAGADHDATRRLLSFYGSTPAYRPVLDVHGWGDLQPELNALSKQGRWDDMAGLITDEVLHTIAACGTPAQIAVHIRERIAAAEGMADTVCLYQPGPIPTDALAAIEAAATPPGQIATLALPADAAWGELPAGQAPLAPDSMRPAVVFRPFDSAAVVAAARALSGPDTLLLLGAGALDDDALTAAGRIAARTGCALMTEFYTAKLSRGAGRVSAARLPYAVDPTVAALARFRQIVLVGARAPIAFFAYPDKPRRLVPAGCALITLTEPEHDGRAALAALAAAALAAADISAAAAACRSATACCSSQLLRLTAAACAAEEAASAA